MPVNSVGGHYNAHSPEREQSQRLEVKGLNNRRIRQSKPRPSILGFKFSAFGTGPAKKVLPQRRVQAYTGQKIPSLSQSKAQRQSSAPREKSAPPFQQGPEKTRHLTNKAGETRNSGLLLQEGRNILRDLMDLNDIKKNLQKMPFQSTERRQQGLLIQIEKKQIQDSVNQFNEKARSAGQEHLVIDMYSVEVGLVNQGKPFLENNEKFKPFFTMGTGGSGDRS